MVDFLWLSLRTKDHACSVLKMGLKGRSHVQSSLAKKYFEDHIHQTTFDELKNQFNEKHKRSANQTNIFAGMDKAFKMNRILKENEQRISDT